MSSNLFEYLLILGDNSMILAHRLSELCGHGPSLETDIALTNTSLDLYGQVRNYFQYAAEIAPEQPGASEDSIAFLRRERQYRNCILLEQPNVDFAHVIVRQFLFDAFQNLQLEALLQSSDSQIAAIAEKSLKESRYHLRFSSEWLKRLGDGTETSHQKTQTALDYLYPFVHEFFDETEIEEIAAKEGYGAKLADLKPGFESILKEGIESATLKIPDSKPRFAQGKLGIHTEQMGYILAELQFMQRAYPNLQW